MCVSRLVAVGNPQKDMVYLNQRHDPKVKGKPSVRMGHKAIPIFPLIYFEGRRDSDRAKRVSEEGPSRGQPVTVRKYVNFTKPYREPLEVVIQVGLFLLWE